MRQMDLHARLNRTSPLRLDLTHFSNTPPITDL